MTTATKGNPYRPIASPTTPPRSRDHAHGPMTWQRGSPGVPREEARNSNQRLTDGHFGSGTGGAGAVTAKAMSALRTDA